MDKQIISILLVIYILSNPPSISSHLLLLLACLDPKVLTQLNKQDNTNFNLLGGHVLGKM